MVSLSTLAVYLPAVLVLTLTPGPAILLTLSRSLAHGRRAGLATAAGLLCGTCILQTGAALGLTAILQISPIAYATLRILGALYLGYLGVRTVLAGPIGLPPAAEARPSPSWRQAFIGGLATELLNPKTAMFYVSVLPQFLDLHAGRVPSQLFVLGGIFVVFAACSLTLVVMLSTRVRALLVGHPRVESASRWLTGCVFVGFGARLAFERR